MPDEIRDKLKPKAIELRKQGWTYREIAGSLDISISTCSLWLRDIPGPPRRGYSQERIAAMWKSRWEPIHVAREKERRKVKLAACDEMGDLSERETLMAGALIYWCEGTKDKSYKRSECVSFINSDPALIILFRRFLDVAGVEPERIGYRLHIHETADLAEATGYWARLVGAPAELFKKPVIKRHNPKTNRKNLVDGYRGCLLIRVRRSADLYRRIEGWAYGAMLGKEMGGARLIARSDSAITNIGKGRERADE
ncbi:helix-turn-helix domain-containing protein [Actinomadura rifamycini]|uniref:helix-turn-helix domain-containing protein n=1 Tax=Actinomadura rifamycini TaxID=31962 RepID=UPI0006863BDF|nr:helix-turn-helix domain-containing protein [Actinomadura rifamycini]